jgi:dTDP-4-amino-4,6-dideoxygalactose transaminase
MINVTKTFLPPINEYMAQVQRAYDNVWLTNRGELIKELEHNIAQVLQLREASILCMNNGTIPIQIALKLLAKGGDVITTPFSYVATTSSILWEACTPIFVDIHPEYLTIDESKIEAAITPRTTCILATHVFGNPCNIEEIERIALKHNLKVIYDAAHSFGVEYDGKSIFEYGHVSTCSFHATKLFHTGEGGAAFCKDPGLFHEIFYSHNFGHNGPLDFHGLGINAKISELQAAMGLAVLPHLEFIIERRKQVVDFYNNELNFSHLAKLKIRPLTRWNYSYYPVLFSDEQRLLEVDAELRKNEITGRRYFYPSLNTLQFIDGKTCPVSEDVSKRIMCLPLYPDLNENQLRKITSVINAVLNA